MLRFFARLIGSQGKQDRQSTPPRIRQTLRLGLEELTPRDLPSASHFDFASAHLFSRLDHTAAGYAEATTVDSLTSTHTAMQADSAHSCNQTDATYVASLANQNGATGTASYNASTGALSVQVAGAAAST